MKISLQKTELDKLLFYKNKSQVNEYFLTGLTEFQRYDIEFGRLQQWLYMNDMNSMMYSVESRSPLLDYNLLKYLDIDPLYKFNQGFNKYMLRQAVPSEISDSVRWRRDKQGFRWRAGFLLRENKEEIFNKVRNSKIIDKFFSKEFITNLLQSVMDVKSEFLVLKLYSICVLEDVYDCVVSDD